MPRTKSRKYAENSSMFKNIQYYYCGYLVKGKRHEIITMQHMNCEKSIRININIVILWMQHIGCIIFFQNKVRALIALQIEVDSLHRCDHRDAEQAYLRCPCSDKLVNNIK